MVGLAIEVDDVRIYFGPILDDASPDLWTEGLRAAFLRAQLILDEALSTPAELPKTTGPHIRREYWVIVDDDD